MRCGIWCRLSALAAAALLAGCDGGSGQPRAEGAWLRLPAVAGRPAAAYVPLRGGREAVKLRTMQVPAARRVDVSLVVTDVVDLRVVDDGTGMGSVDGADGVEGAPSHGHGLENMATRAKRHGGSFTIQPGPAGGTAVVWIVPLQPERTAT